MTATAKEPRAHQESQEPQEPQGNPRKRRAILNAAGTVFLRDGFTRAGIDAIAAEAKVSKQTVYNHFGDKERLFMAMTDDVQDRTVAHVMELMDRDFPDPSKLTGPEDLRAALLQLAGEWIRVVYTGPLVALRKLVDAESEHHPYLQQRWFTNGPSRTMPRLNRLLSALARAGLLDVPAEVLDVPDLLAYQLTAMAGSAVRRIEPGVDFEAEFQRRVAQGVDFFLRAYAPR
ncbi:TetR/AcrR family transcriptional regulator [Catenulispora pinisilvae]|uniref:TetR/AcrR family transcriptional regulator n=1 Tax=Catenulispora pinisilvae TaxID=2705253 RepID=UPI001892493F|nr:TetR/AcrR family transcriptional regulator [Catenulispora pinisilvae]